MSGAELAKALGEQNLLAREPWRAIRLQRQQQASSCTEGQDLEAQRDLVAEFCKQSLLSRSEVLASMYMFFEGDQSFYRSLLLETSPIEAVRRHNWGVAEASGEHFINKYGSILERLPDPLFPPNARFVGLNIKLLTQFMALDTRRTVGGGGVEHSSLYRQEQTEGGLFLPVVGQVDTKSLDSELVREFAELKAVVARLASQQSSQQQRSRPRQHQSASAPHAAPYANTPQYKTARPPRAPPADF